MNRSSLVLAILLAGGCSMPDTGPQPSLAPRPAEAIDPRVPIPDAPAHGTLDAELAARLDAQVGSARSGIAAFEARQAEADRLAAAAGPAGSESWIAAQQALSLLIEQHGVATRAAAQIDELAATRIERQRWIEPADQAAIAGAAAEVAAISARQAEAIDRVKDRLAR